jgi:Ser/Thr protein kinase RdoA (MazF antagonist)
MATINRPLSQMSRVEKHAFFVSYAHQALNQYDIGRYHAEFLNHREGATFQVNVRETDTRYHLRLHNPTPGGDAQWLRPEVINSGLQWLEALAQDTDIDVQQPVRARQDQWLTQVKGEADEFIICSLLTWVDGVDGLSMPLRTPQDFFRMGELMARLHEHANHWQIPPDFVRPHYNETTLRTTLEAIEANLETGRFLPDEAQLFRDALGRGLETMEGLEKNPDNWGIVHGDMGYKGNCVFHRNRVSPIDFNDCAFAYYLYDIAYAFLYIDAGYRRTFLEGYERLRRLPHNFQSLIETFMVVGQINLLARLASRPQENFNYVPRFARNECLSLLQGRSFLFQRAWWE